MVRHAERLEVIEAWTNQIPCEHEKKRLAIHKSESVRIAVLIECAVDEVFEAKYVA